MNEKQKAEYGDQYAATEALQNKWDEANKEYMRFVKVARVLLQSKTDAFVKLGLGGVRKNILSGWLTRAKQFYNNSLADQEVLSRLANYRITQAKLEQGRKLVLDTEDANLAQKREKGEAQQATLVRDKALDKLEEWLSNFISISRIALEEKSQLLEKMGIIEPS